MLFIQKKIKRTNKDESKDIKNDWLDYKNDTFHGLEWRWVWRKNTGKWNVDDLSPVCPKCKTTMDLDNGYSYNSATCPRCDNYLTNIKSPIKIEAIIIDNVKRDLYNN